MYADIQQQSVYIPTTFSLVLSLCVSENSHMLCSKNNVEFPRVDPHTHCHLPLHFSTHNYSTKPLRFCLFPVDVVTMFMQSLLLSPFLEIITEDESDNINAIITYCGNSALMTAFGMDPDYRILRFHFDSPPAHTGEWHPSILSTVNQAARFVHSELIWDQARDSSRCDVFRELHPEVCRIPSTNRYPHRWPP